MCAASQPYPHSAHLTGSFRLSRLPKSRQAIVYLFVLFTNPLELAVAKDIDSRIFGIELLIRASIIFVTLAVFRTIES